MPSSKKRSLKEKTIPILFEDDHLIVAFKPPLTLMIPPEDSHQDNMLHYLNKQYAHLPTGVHPCHRLDKDTSGVALFAKGKKAQQELMKLFHARKIKKTYIAFIHGYFKEMEGTIKRPIRDIYQSKFKPRTDGQKATTRFKVLSEREDFSVVELEPITGRTHQLRIHCAKVDHPIVGEHQYAFRKDFKLKFRRVALHASTLSFKHPWTKEQVTFEAPMAKDMEKFLKAKK